MTKGLDNILRELESRVSDILKEWPRALVSVIGKNGSGKSYLGRHIRKHGLGRFPRKDIVVIDDGTMFVEFVRVFTRRVKIPTTGIDELEPFYNAMPGHKKIVIYINATPARRITGADILVSLSTDEETRRKRLAERYGEGSERFKKYFERPEITDSGIRYTYRIDGET